MSLLSNDSTIIGVEPLYVQTERSSNQSPVNVTNNNVNPFEKNETDSNIGLDTFESNKKNLNKYVIPKTKNYKVKKGEYWYKIVQQEYGVKEHNKIMEIVHKLKDENKVDHKNNIMPATIKLLSDVTLKNGDFVVLLNPPMEEKPGSVKTDDKEKTPAKTDSEEATVKTENKEVPVIQQKTESIQAEQSVSQTASEETKKDSTIAQTPKTDALNPNEPLKKIAKGKVIAEITKARKVYKKNGQIIITPQKYFTNVRVEEIVPEKKDENGNVIEESLVVFRCDQGIFPEDKDGLPGGLPLTEEDVQIFKEMLEE